MDFDYYDFEKVTDPEVSVHEMTRFPEASRTAQRREEWRELRKNRNNC